jgi:hypothetical protein
MSLSAYAVLSMLSILSVVAAQRLARHQARRPVAWMIAATFLGSFPLIPLALNA